jgi:hypothetical protein
VKKAGENGKRQGGNDYGIKVGGARTTLSRIVMQLAQSELHFV